jgi:hypothetical protein
MARIRIGVVGGGLMAQAMQLRLVAREDVRWVHRMWEARTLRSQEELRSR